MSGARARKYYALTMDGEEALRQMDMAWGELTNTVDKLKGMYLDGSQCTVHGS